MINVSSSPTEPHWRADNIDGTALGNFSSLEGALCAAAAELEMKYDVDANRILSEDTVIMINVEEKRIVVRYPNV